MTTLPKVPLNPVFLHQLEIMKAIVEGKQIQTRRHNNTQWDDWLGLNNSYKYLNFEMFAFRVKPPEPRVFYTVLRSTGEAIAVKATESEAEQTVKELNGGLGLLAYRPYSYIKVVEEIKES